MKILKWPVMVVVLAICSSCASIMSGSRQTIPVYSTPEGAMVVINDSAYGKTPMHMDMKRKRKGREVKLVLDGYEPFSIRMQRTWNPWVLGNIIFGGLIGLGVDAISGGMYEIYPDNINAELKKTSP